MSHVGSDVGVRGSNEQEETGVPGGKPPAEAWVGDHLPSHIRPFAESGIRTRDLRGTIIITITLIAYNRYKLVLDPGGYKQLYTRRNIALMITCAWVIPVLCLLPALIEVWGKFGYVAMLVTCNLLLDHQSQSYKLFLLVVRAGIPCALIVYYYAHIFITTHRSHMRMRYAQKKTSSSMEARNHKKEMRLTRMMAIIFVVFILSYFPCTITGIIDWNTVLSKQFHMFCAITVYIGSALNPLIYGLMNSQFRKAYLRLLCCNKLATYRLTGKGDQVERKSVVTSCRKKTRDVMCSTKDESETKEKLVTSEEKLDNHCSSCDDSDFVMTPTEYNITVTFSNTESKSTSIE
ncbi:hypothetical protein FSP39_022636 [Pinctada imbricata]|uniref:G-protein coupled receptors family 1 profile domain-containing protein n=1 Tax=Pinctada imbricata TaxID=66713 RepID=A0AA88YFB0_PINIB|nr:hypothetical protein FSP39_022636 [Pinctada imbricata]